MIKSTHKVRKLDFIAAPALSWGLNHKRPFSWTFEQVAVVMKHWKFAVFYLSTVALALTLIMLASTLEPIRSIMDNFWGVYLMSQCWTLMIAGIGLALPVIVITFGFGWLQLFLLANGQIEPHLTSEGFGSALKTIFGKIFS